MKKIFENPEVIVSLFESDDIINTSTPQKDSTTDGLKDEATVNPTF